MGHHIVSSEKGVEPDADRALTGRICLAREAPLRQPRLRRGWTASSPDGIRWPGLRRWRSSADRSQDKAEVRSGTREGAPGNLDSRRGSQDDPLPIGDAFDRSIRPRRALPRSALAALGSQRRRASRLRPASHDRRRSLRKRGERGDSNPRPPGPQLDHRGCAQFGSPMDKPFSFARLLPVLLKLVPQLVPFRSISPVARSDFGPRTSQDQVALRLWREHG
jgi:hypothetical protein